jgi:hypothetical protein
MQHPELFDTASKFAAVNRLTGISDAQKGAQFKTNTTNDAIDFYQKNVDIRVDEKIDAIEDWIGMIAWQVLQMVAQHWSVEDVAAIIGQELAQTGSKFLILQSFVLLLIFVLLVVLLISRLAR